MSFDNNMGLVLLLTRLQIPQEVARIRISITIATPGFQFNECPREEFIDNYLLKGVLKPENWIDNHIWRRDRVCLFKASAVIPDDSQVAEEDDIFFFNKDWEQFRDELFADYLIKDIIVINFPIKNEAQIEFNFRYYFNLYLKL